MPRKGYKYTDDAKANMSKAQMGHVVSLEARKKIAESHTGLKQTPEHVANMVAAITKHGHAREGKRTRTYKTWENMKQRCLNSNNPKWEYYGGKGITVCTRWLTFKNFLADMGERPEGKSIDRISNRRGYYKKNCRWATKSEQYLNRSKP